jgi:hypothetical protein
MRLSTVCALVHIVRCPFTRAKTLGWRSPCDAPVATR